MLSASTTPPVQGVLLGFLYAARCCIWEKQKAPFGKNKTTTLAKRKYADYHQRYSLHAVYGRYVCHYCGETAPTIDHCPPLSVLDSLLSVGLQPETPPVTVPCCSECNSVLSDAPPSCPDVRRDIVQGRLRRRHQRLLATPDWSLGRTGGHRSDTARDDRGRHQAERRHAGAVEVAVLSYKLPSRIILALLAFVMALALQGWVAPDNAPRRAPAAVFNPRWLGRPHTQPPRPKSTLEDTYPDHWRAIGFDANTTAFSLQQPDPTRPSLTIAPRVGIAPLAVSLTLRLATPHPSDRELDLSVWGANDEDMAAPLFRSTRDVLWPTDRQPIPQTLRAHWRLPAGSWVVVGCVWPRSACTSVRVEVS